MSTNFYIAPYRSTDAAFSESKSSSDSDLRIDPVSYGKAIHSHWPEALTENPVEPNTAQKLQNWILPTKKIGFSGLRVILLPNLQTVSLGTGPKDIFLEYILWHRRNIPTQYPLYLFNLSAPESLELTGSTTAQDIIDFTGLVE